MRSCLLHIAGFTTRIAAVANLSTAQIRRAPFAFYQLAIDGSRCFLWFWLGVGRQAVWRFYPDYLSRCERGILTNAIDGGILLDGRSAEEAFGNAVRELETQENVT